MKRGDIVMVSAPGAYGKPSPAVIVQSDWLDGTDSVLVSRLTSTIRDAPIFRLSLDPSPGNGLRVPSQIMVDKILALPRDKCGAVIRTPFDPFGMAEFGFAQAPRGLADTDPA